MKKTLAVAAVLAAFAGSAAADVTLYGGLDTGLAWTHTAGAVTGADSVQMKHSMNETSMFGLKGSEKISENLTVGFKMESYIKADTGKFESEAFNREVNLYFQTAYGEFGFGRTGSLAASTGSYAFLGGGNTGFGGGMGPVGDNGVVFLAKGTRNDNSVTYKSPTMAGVTLYAQVATAGDAETEYTHDVNRFYAVGAQYAAGALKAGLVVNQTDWAEETVGVVAGDELGVSAFVNYDFGVAKVYLSGQYFDNADATADFAGYKGYGLIAAVSAPVAGGTAKAMVGYNDADGVADATKDLKTVQLGAAYVYPLSKTAGLYTAAGYINKEYANKTRDESVSAIAGVYKKF